ncbi:hypothetical protein [Nostoc sp. LPT]|nr:hypothetical protein [Nostoc sp. LPT]
MHWHCKVLPNLIRYELMKCCTKRSRELEVLRLMEVLKKCHHS